MKTRGFITIATGNEAYYQLAWNLLRSYRHFCDDPLPFAILCEQKNVLTEDFDDVLLFKDTASRSYLDKLCLDSYLPYDETIFIDADCLAFANLNVLFDYFQEADDFSCFGRVLPLGDKTGWFEYDNLGELKDRVSYVVGLHGGIYYMRRGEICARIFRDAKAFIPEYARFRFKGKFSNPGDEPLIALSMAVNHCRPILFRSEAICCYWEHVGHMTIDITQGLARVNSQQIVNTSLIHWGTRYTRELEYKKQVALLDLLVQNAPDKKLRIHACEKHYARLLSAEKRKTFVRRVKNKLKRTIGLS